MLANAIKMDSNNAELRLLRLAAQTKAPSFLGYHQDIKRDKRFLKHRLPHIKNAPRKKFIIERIKELNLFHDPNH
jgi:hypothetical protein